MINGKGGDVIKQKWLHNKLQADCHYSCLKPEIEQALDLGRAISISPSYTFYYSKEIGLRYIKNVQIIRIYGGFVVGRHSISYIIIENNDRGIIKLKGTVNYLKMRIIYNQFCPDILIGKKGREMGLEQLAFHYEVRKKVFFIITVTVLCWFFVGFICQYLDSWLGLIIFTLSTFIVLLISIRILYFMMKVNSDKKR